MPHVSDEKGVEVTESSSARPDVLGSRKYLFRGDESYRDGSIGRELGEEADSADIQDFAEHVLRKESTRSSRFTSFTEELKIARSIFTSAADNRFVIKVELSALRELESKGAIRIWDPEQVSNLLNQGPRKLAKRAADVRTAMRRNREVLVEGRIPGEIIETVYS